MLRVLPHVGHSLLPKNLDPVVRENYNRTGTLTPDQVHAELFSILESNPEGKLLIYFLNNSDYLQFHLVTVRQLVESKKFDDLNHWKLLLSLGGGANSIKEGTLFSVLKVSYFFDQTEFSVVMISIKFSF